MPNPTTQKSKGDQNEKEQEIYGQRGAGGKFVKAGTLTKGKSPGGKSGTGHQKRGSVETIEEDLFEEEETDQGSGHETEAGSEESGTQSGAIAGKGHNQAPFQIAKDQLRSLVERIERLEEEKADVASDIKDVYAEAKGNGYDVKTLRRIIALRKKDAAERDEEEYLLDTYKSALGMISELTHGAEA